MDYKTWIKKERDILMDLVEDRHGRASAIIASQIPVIKRYDVIGEGTVADAILIVSFTLLSAVMFPVNHYGKEINQLS